MKNMILTIFLISSNSFATHIDCKLRVIEEISLQEGSNEKALGVKAIRLSDKLEHGQNFIEESIDQAKFRITRFENNLVSATIIQDISISKKQTTANSKSIITENNTLDLFLELDTLDGRLLQESISCKTVDN